MPSRSLGDQLEKLSLVDLAVGRLTADILSGRFVPGERLIEEQLTSRFGISRGPLREALRLLGQQGLVEHLPRRGVRVTRLSDRDVAELFGLRSVLEGHAVELALVEGPPAAIGLVDEALQEMAAAAESGDGLATAEAHNSLHLAVVATAQNRQLLASYTPIVAKLQLHMAANLAQERAVASPMQGVVRHRRLRDALASGDKERVFRELEQHGHRTFFR